MKKSGQKEMSKQSKDKVVSFEEEAHEYTIGDRVLVSGTTFLSQFFEKFDAEGIATKLSKFPVNKKRKMTKAKFLKEWRESAEHGSRVHLLLEKFLLHENVGKVCLENRDLVKFMWGVGYIQENFWDIGGKVTPEVIVYNEELGIAGQIDVLQETEETFVIHDWKTNKEIKTSSAYKKKAREPISELDDCNYNKYKLQLNLYAYMYSLATGKVCKELHLVHLTEDGYEDYEIEIDYETIKRLLEWTKTH